MDFGKSFADPELEKEGVWVDYLDGASVRLARAGNVNFSRMYSNKMKPHRRQQDDGTLDPDIETKILCEVMAETILLDWKQITVEGKEFKYSNGNAFKMLYKYQDFRLDMANLAASQENFFAKIDEDSAKN